MNERLLLRLPHRQIVFYFPRCSAATSAIATTSSTWSADSPAGRSGEPPSSPTPRRGRHERNYPRSLSTGPRRTPSRGRPGRTIQSLALRTDDFSGQSEPPVAFGEVNFIAGVQGGELGTEKVLERTCAPLAAGAGWRRIQGHGHLIVHGEIEKLKDGKTTVHIFHSGIALHINSPCGSL
jgi:hypothetical protein